MAPHSNDDDFQDPIFQSLPLTQTKKPIRPQMKNPLKPSNSPINRPRKNPNNRQQPFTHGKENLPISIPPHHHNNFAQKSTLESSIPPDLGLECSLDSIESTIDGSFRVDDGGQSQESEKMKTKLKGGFSYSCNSVESRLLKSSSVNCALSVCEKDGGVCENDDGFDDGGQSQESEKMKSKLKGGFSYSSNSVESRLLKSSSVNCAPSVCEKDGGVCENDGGVCENDGGSDDEFEPDTQLDVLLRLCSEVDGQVNSSKTTSIHCPLCGDDISDLSDELRQVHTNECLDKEENPNDVAPPDDGTRHQNPGLVLDGSPIQSPRQAVDVSPVLEWLRSLGLAKYEDVFVREEIDWDSLQWLTEEDLLSMGVTALGPRKKIIHALSQFRKEGTNTTETHTDAPKAIVEETEKLVANKLITDYFPGHVADRPKICITSRGKNKVEKSNSDSGRKSVVVKNHVKNRKLRDIPLWCSIPGTPFRVDAFKYLRRDCFHWFLTHFHIDHYQGLTRSFCHGKIYCSSITAKLVNLKIGIPWDKIQVLPLNQKINIDGIDITCFDANHCPGSIIILFEPPSGQAVLHTGDFRFSEDMAKISGLQASCVNTLILDTTYCDPQYDFPKQEAVIQFVIEAIQAEAFNPKTLFLIGSYTIGKERLFLEVARVLRKKVYVTLAKLRILECLGLPNEDMQWLTTNEHESHIHVVPMWTLASFKRLKHISTQYQSRFSLVVAISPTGWTFGKGKKKSPGRRWQQGTIIRYEVPYSEHCSFTELREFVKLISPVNIIPSVNNEGPESTAKMLSLLSSLC